MTKLRLKTFKAQSIKKIEQGLVKNGKHNKKFIKSVVLGLAKSSVYNKTLQ